MNPEAGRLMQLFHFKIGFAYFLKKMFPEAKDEDIIKAVQKIK